MDLVLILRIVSTVVIPSTFIINNVTILKSSGQAILSHSTALTAWFL